MAPFIAETCECGAWSVIRDRLRVLRQDHEQADTEEYRGQLTIKIRVLECLLTTIAYKHGVELEDAQLEAD